MKNQRVIASLRNNDDLEAVLNSEARTVFLLSADVCQLEEQCARLRDAGRQVFLHLDLVDGLKGDESGIRFAARRFRLTGIISTRATCLKQAKEEGLLAIQRVFMLDSSALRTGQMHAQSCKPDFVEVLPGISAKIIKLAVANFQVPIIAGGLISDWEDVENAFAAGASAVSTSHRDLWRKVRSGREKAK